ncbi:MAG: 4-alpha-glucanotransferase [Verrucomicrobiota bacterium]|jgi:4-alpha-glucanotransferase|nr:4-alpha-glucanotransferase [Verrucomicrobiota bacterium]
MKFERASGVLLHPTSLPGPYGIGEMGPEAYRFADFLQATGQRLWQILPLGPTSFGDSPYQTPSTFAGNPLWISFDLLIQDKLLTKAALKKFPAFPEDAVDFGPVIQARMDVLRKVCDGFEKKASAAMKAEFVAFCERNAYWLEDYALYTALKDAHGGVAWTEWESEYAKRSPLAMQQARETYAHQIHGAKVMQYLFENQWRRLRAYCEERQIKFVGDLPIFVAHDSADVWANPTLFYLDPDGQPSVVAGVPPDYFSETGQLWGNPLYNWEAHRAQGYDWWAARLRRVFEFVDIVRIDHFRGFEAYWEIPGDAATAINGKWVKGPDRHLFDVLFERMGPLPIIAEDLGVITPPVEELREHCGFPGMRILQFAFGGDERAVEFRPESYPAHCVVYTGTHDNDTTVGWFHSHSGEGSTRTEEQIEAEHRLILDYLRTDGHEINWDLIRLGAQSNADTFVVPLQDLIGLGSEARMNTPGVASGNWQWRFRWEQLNDAIRDRFAHITRSTGRTH